MKRIIPLLLILVFVVVSYAGTPPSKWKDSGGSAIINKSADSIGIIQNSDTLWITNSSLGWHVDSMLTRATLDSLVVGLGRFSLGAGSSLWDSLGTSDTLMYISGVDTFFIFNLADGWAINRAGLSTVDSLEANDFVRFIDGTDSLTLTPALVDSIVNQKGVYASGSGSTDSLYVNDTTEFSTEGWKQSGDTLHQDTTQHLALQDTSTYTTDIEGRISDSLALAFKLADTGAYTTKLQVLMGDSARQAAADSIALALRLADTSAYTLKILLSSDTAIGDTAALIRTILGQITDDTTNYQTAYGWGDHSVAGYMNDGLVNVYKYFDRTYFDTLIDANGDSIIVVYSDSTGKVDTAYAPLVALIQNHSDSGNTSLDSAQVVTIVTDSGFAKTTALSSYLPLAGGTMSGNIAMGSNSVTGIDSLIGGTGNPTIDFGKYSLDSIRIDSIIEKTGRYNIADSASKIDTTYAAFQTYVGNQITSPTLNNVTVYGDLSVSGYPSQWNHGTDLDITDAWAINGIELKLWSDSTPTVDSAFMHPSVVYIPEGYLGYKVWMITTSSIGDGEEGFLWVTNTFDTLGNPIDFHQFIDSSNGTVGIGDTLYNPLVNGTEAGGTPTDCHLFFGADAKMHVFMRVANVAKDSVFFIEKNTSTGLTWSSLDTIFSEKTWNSNASPTIFLDTNSTYKMFYVAVDTLTDSNKVVLYSSDSVSGPWVFIDTTDMRPTNDATRDIWHLSVVPYSPDYYLAIIYEATNSGQSGGGISIAESRDGGLTWSDAKQVLTMGANGRWDDYTLYRADGYWVENGTALSMKMIYSAKYDSPDSTWGVGVTDINFYDSTTSIPYGDTTNVIASKKWVRDSSVLWSDTIATTGVPTKAWVRDSSVLHGTVQRIVYIPVSWISGRTGIPADGTDSVHLSLPIMKGIVSTFAKDSSFGMVSFDTDTLYFSWDALPYNIVSVDSVIFTHISDTIFNKIQALNVITPTSGSVMADSVHATDLIGTDLEDTTWAKEAIGINLSSVTAGEQFVLRMRTYMLWGRNIWFGRMYLVCTVNVVL